MKKVLSMIISLAVVSLLVGCSFSQDSAEIGTSKGVVSIGFADQYSYDDYYEDYDYGEYYKVFELAKEDIAKLDSPVEIQLVQQYDNADYTIGLSVAQSLCDDSTMVGVVGHIDNDLCLYLKNVYDNNGMPLLVPTIGSTELLEDNKGYIYQTMPKLSIDTMFYTMLSHTEGMKNVAVIYTDSTYGKEMASQFTYYMMDDVTSNTKVVDQVCNPDIYTEIPNCLKKWKALDVDTVFIFSDLDGVYTYLPIIEEMDNDINVYLSSDYESFFLTEYYDYLSKYDNVYQMSSVQYDYNAELEEFCQRYSDTYGTRPDSTMVQIYDDIMIIAKAIAYNGVRTREDLKEFLDTTDDIGSIYGEGLYFKNNSIQNKMMFVQSYDSNGELTSSIGFTNTEIYEIWWYYYAEELIDEYAKVGEYDSE